MSESIVDEQIRRHTASLRRLVFAGWTATVIGDPSDPEALVYVHQVPGISDVILVRSYDDAVATRTVMGRAVKTIEGTVIDVVDHVLSWSPLVTP